MSAFATALDALMGDANLAVDVQYRQGGSSAPTTLRAILSQPDLDVRFGDSRVRAASTRIMLRISDVPLLAPGDTLEINSVVYVLYEAPEKDSSRLSWSVDLEIDG